jgi:hypothetical protein
MYTERERKESTQILGQAAAFEVTAGQCGAQDGSKPPNSHGSRATETQPSSKCRNRGVRREFPGAKLTSANGEECRRRRRPRLGRTRAVGTPNGAERGKAPLLASGPLAGAAAASRLGARRWAGQGTVGLGGREVGKPKGAGFFFCTHTTTATATATPHPESTTSWLLRFLDHTLIFQFCYSRSSCCIREQIRRHFRWVSPKRTVKRFSARLQLCYKGRRAVKMPRFQVVIQFDSAVAAYRQK